MKVNREQVRRRCKKHLYHLNRGIVKLSQVRAEISSYNRRQMKYMNHDPERILKETIFKSFWGLRVRQNEVTQYFSVMFCMLHLPKG